MSRTIYSFTGMPRWAVVSTVTTLLVVVGCSSPSGPSDDRFDFKYADHNAHWLLGPDVMITGGVITLGRNDTIEQRLSLACGAESPGCSVPTGWARFQGVVDRSPVTPAGDMLVQWSDGRTALLRLAGDTAWVGHPLPPSHGFGGQGIFRFER